MLGMQSRSLEEQQMHLLIKIRLCELDLLDSGRKRNRHQLGFQYTRDLLLDSRGKGWA